MLDPITGRMERYLDLLSMRQKLVTSNIANADTPGYRTQDIDFQYEFLSQLDSSAINPEVRGVAGLDVKNDGNDVNLDRENRMLAENAIRFNAAASMLKNQIALVRSAIQEGKSA